MTFTFRIDVPGDRPPGYFQVKAGTEQAAWDQAWEVWETKERPDGAKLSLAGIER